MNPSPKAMTASTAKRTSKSIAPPFPRWRNNGRGGLGVPAGFYHFAFEAGSAAGLAEKRDELRAKGVEVTDIVDHGWAQSIYFADPNGLSLEYCCQVRNLTKDDARMQERFTVRRAALDFSGSDLEKVLVTQSVHGKRNA